MRFTLLAVIVGLVAGYVAGGSHRHLSDLHMRRAWLPALWAAIYVVVARVHVPWAVPLLLMAHLGFLVFVALNVRRTRGLWLVGVGLLLNVSVLMVNHTTPYRPSALRAAGIHEQHANDVLRSSAVGRPERDGDRLMFLADVIPLNAGPFHEVLSVGDLLLGAGMGLVVFQALQPLHRRRRTRGANSDVDTVVLDHPSIAGADKREIEVEIDLTEPRQSVVELTSAPPVSGPVADSWPRSASSSAIELLLRSSLADSADLDADADIAGDEFWATRQQQQDKGGI